MYTEQNILDLHELYSREQMDNRAAFFEKTAPRKAQQFKQWLRERHTSEVNKFVIEQYYRENPTKGASQLGNWVVTWWQTHSVEETLDLITIHNNQTQSNNEQDSNTGRTTETL